MTIPNTMNVVHIMDRAIEPIRILMLINLLK